jgi:hypothetical protein
VPDPRPDPEALRQVILADGERHHWMRDEAVPTLQQLLMAENKPLRLLLVDLLDQIRGPHASASLAGRAVYDVDAEVREAAVRALRERPAEEYTPVLLDGLRYPWAPAADHAAEALVFLGVRDAVPELLALLDQPAPDAPCRKSAGSAPVVRELVRINHLNNCLLCHAPSIQTGDLVRGRQPDPSRPLPPPFSPEYYVTTDASATFVRADVTYLRQDFSVRQPVSQHGPWPEYQRYDYLVRLRTATPAEVATVRGPGPQQQAVLFALRELTGADPGPSAEDWKRHFFRADKAVKATGNRGL